MSYRAPHGFKHNSRIRHTLIQLVVLGMAAATLVTVSQPTPAVAAPQNFTSETVVSGLSQPVSIGFLPDGRMLALEKNGRRSFAWAWVAYVCLPTFNSEPVSAWMTSWAMLIGEMVSRQKTNPSRVPCQMLLAKTSLGSHTRAKKATPTQAYKQR